ncbi:AAA family ATPase [Okeania sp. SIO2B3]|uniref:AAA family ATPase n=1 Tax=Okeania sp. SIO2B3 TaxID=2607784 RepID=UPI0013BEFF44|nr:AAA family ATPase [Okeania sp. SIO2B3]NET43443.1 AAA family ATPase [Okeania sp. SIO2B3]
MKIKRLEIKCFRGIKNLTIDFSTTEPTVFIGINGVGKSRILDCIAILFSWLLVRIQYEPKKTTHDLDLDDDDYIDKSEGRYFSQQDVTNGCEETKCESIFSINCEIIFSIDGLENQIGLAQNNGGGWGISIKSPSIADDIRTKLKDNSQLNIPLIVYYPVNRFVLDLPIKIEENYGFRQVDAYEDALSGTQINFGGFFKWFRIIEDTENEERRDNPEYRDRLLQAVREAIYSILGKNDFNDFRARRKPRPRMTIKKQDQELDIQQLSDGEKNLLALVGDLARRLAIANPSLGNPLKASSVVLIDEIEQHLHPAWQRQVIPKLTETFPNCQFIITTHSPQVVSQIKPNSVYILEKIDDNVILKHPSSSFGRDSNRILEDLMKVPERPQEIKEKLMELFRLIDSGNLDSARQLRLEIEEEIGTDEPEFVRADILMRRREILKK